VKKKSSLESEIGVQSSSRGLRAGNKDKRGKIIRKIPYTKNGRKRLAACRKNVRMEGEWEKKVNGEAGGLERIPGKGPR